MQQRAVETWNEPKGQRLCDISATPALHFVDGYTVVAHHRLKVTLAAAKSHN